MNVGEVAFYPVDPTNASASIVRIYCTGKCLITRLLNFIICLGLRYHSRLMFEYHGIQISRLAQLLASLPRQLLMDKLMPNSIKF